MKNKTGGETLAQEEARVIVAVEHDEANRITREQDHELAAEVDTLLVKDPTFIDKVHDASDRGMEERTPAPSLDGLIDQILENEAEADTNGGTSP